MTSFDMPLEHFTGNVRSHGKKICAVVIRLTQIHLENYFKITFSCMYSHNQCFDAVGWVAEGHPACKNRVVGCWRGYLSGARCRLAYGPADDTATHCLLLQ